MKRTAEPVEPTDAVLDFREIGEHIYDGVYITDGAGRTLYVNGSYERITGIARDELIGRNVDDLVAEGLYTKPVTPEVLRQRRQAHSVGQSRRNGARLLITGSPIFDERGEIKLVAVVARDITDLARMRTELEAAQEKMRAVEDGVMKARREVEHLRGQMTTGGLVGSSAALRKVMELVRQVADFDVTVLICGETGVGKEVVASEIHALGNRRNRAFVKVNCAALPAGLIEAELFGYERGAFTGAATGGKIGLFELADTGTILLDEIGDMPLDLQGKLLRTIQHKEVTRIGGTKAIKVDVRILAATNRDLRADCREGRFREDLYYRLAVLPIDIPPLRERSEDVAPLALHFLADDNRRYGRRVSLGAEALDLLTSYAWPGNARELQNVIERLVLVSQSETVVSRSLLLSLLELDQDRRPVAEDRRLRDLVDDVERRAIAVALERHGTTRRAAAALGIDQSTLVKKVKRLNLARRRGSPR